MKLTEPKVHMAMITGGEARALLPTNPVILLPMGSHEDQGPHSPMGDYMLAEKVAELAALKASQSGTRALVAPVVPFGGADFFGPMVGGIAITPATLTSVITDMVASLNRNGLTRLIVILFSTFFLRAYRKPRELTWVTGVLLLFIMMGFGFSGYLLPWNELAFFATKVGTGIAGAVPGIGPFMVRFLRGGDEVTGATLTRFYGIHVAILPAITTVLLGVHLLFIQRQGMSVPPSVEKREKAGEKIPQEPFFPNYILHDVMWWYVALAVLAALALFLPWELGKKADAFAPVPAGIRPEWYFLAMFQVLKLLPSHIVGIEGEMLGVLAFSLVAGLLVVVPFLDRGAAEGRPSRILTAAGILAVLYLIIFTIYGYLAA